MRIHGVPAVALAFACGSTALAAPKRPPPPDLADAVQGVYHGDVISDSRGAGRTEVTITVTKTGHDTVQVSSDYPRLPPFSARLSRYMNTIQKSDAGGQVFSVDTSKSPPHLDVTDDQASWSGAKGGSD